ncbi:MAG TPA: divergent polysaccharide deacetylase family protein [Stellaceae bacterium]|nr:divergent polysaccharide deacetylase family protein [Stellaceae bacterium]
MARRGPEPEADGRRSSLSGRLLVITVLLLVSAAGGVIGWLAQSEKKAPERQPLPALSMPLPKAAPAPSPPATAQLPPQPAAPAPAPMPPPSAPPTAVQAPAPVPAPPVLQQQAAVPPAKPQPPPPPRPPLVSRAEPLAPAPDPGLVERSDQGPLPIVGADGRKPWQVYAKPFDRADKRPRIAVMMTGLGLSGAATEAAVNDLSGSVTLVFNPYAQRLDEWIQRARAAGHEVFLSLPMEPINYPRMDPGPHTLLVALDSKQNLERLQWVLSRVTGYVGTVSAAGSRFTTSKSDLLPVLDALNHRGLMFVDARSTDRSIAGSLARSIGLPRASVDIVLDQQASRDAIDQRLAQLEALARQNGVAVAAGDAYPVTIERLAQWIPTLEAKGLALAPVSATADMQSDRTAEATR